MKILKVYNAVENPRTINEITEETGIHHETVKKKLSALNELNKVTAVSNSSGSVTLYHQRKSSRELGDRNGE